MRSQPTSGTKNSERNAGDLETLLARLACLLIEARGCVVNRGSRAGLEESEALRRSSSSTTHPAMFGFTGGEGDAVMMMMMMMMMVVTT